MLKDFYISFDKALLFLYPEKSERSALFFYLVEEVLGLNRTQIRLLLIENSSFEEKHFIILKEALEKLKKGIPIQYILGWSNFLDLKILVNKHVLIPREETSELVSWVLEENKQKENLKIFDLATGSGAIALALKYYLKGAYLDALDISREALEVAKKNAASYNLEIDFEKGNILKEDFGSKKNKYDLIISNPPYIRESENIFMHKNVLENEPSLALFISDDDPLIFYRKIAHFAKKRLNPKGLLYFEINQYLAIELKNLLQEIGYEVELKKDSYQNFRMIKCFLKENQNFR